MSDAKILWSDTIVDPLNWWPSIAEKFGCDDATLARPFLLCIRGVELGADNTHENIAQVEPPDTGVLIYRGGARVFPMSSVPMQTRSKASPDVDGDGQGDVACVKVGRYLLTDLGPSAGPYPVFAVSMPDGSGRVPCSRDLKHDGRIDHEGPAIYTASQILLHTNTSGLKLNPPSPHVYSIGCSTTSLEWLLFLRERTKATGSGKADYVIANADDVIAVAKESPYLDLEPTKPINLDKGIV